MAVAALSKEDGLDKTLFSEGEWESIHYFKREEDQQIQAACFILCSSYLDGSILHNKYGKPFIKEGPCFSISHSYPYVVLAVSSCPIGVDVEAKQKWDDKLTKACFTDQEQKLSIDRLRLWTLKEASYKVKGKEPFLPQEDGVDIRSKTLLSFMGEEYFYRFASDETKELSIVSTEELTMLQVETLSFRQLTEQRRTNHGHD